MQIGCSQDPPATAGCYRVGGGRHDCCCATCFCHMHNTTCLRLPHNVMHSPSYPEICILLLEYCEERYGGSALSSCIVNVTTTVSIIA